MSIHHFWTAGGSIDFGFVPAGILDLPIPTPIRLQCGDLTFGEIHIRNSHWHWVSKHASSVPELVWRKCRQSGQFYDAEAASKFKIAMVLHPAAVMILKYINRPGDPFFSVTTLYALPSALDGQHLGRYVDTMLNPASQPKFAPPPPVQITYRRKRITGGGGP